MSWTDNATTEAFADNSCGAGNPCFPGGKLQSSQLCSVARFGNGQGFNTEHPAFGLPAGGLGPDNRIGIYLGDSWKVKPNLTVNLGYGMIAIQTALTAICQQFQRSMPHSPGWGNPVQQANLNLAPQLGIAWDPRKNGRP